MKDEEMAEQFADNISGLDLTCSLLSAKDKSHAYRLGRYDGFLAGLKAGRPQWHDLRKNSNDLPKESCSVFVIYKYESKTYRDNYINDKEHNIIGWESEYKDPYCAPQVIAWCEIPTFDKE